MNYLFASTNFGCETLLEQELVLLGAKKTNVIKGGIYYEGNSLLLYQSLMWSRLASRIFLLIKKFTINNADHLYQQTCDIIWSNIFDIKKSFLVNFKGTNNFIRNSLFGALTIKDAIVDHFKKKYFDRPNVNLIQPDIRIKALLHQNTVCIMLDLSGDSLNKRGYRISCNNIAPMKENLGAAVILHSDWKKNTPLIDPMCGSGTLLIEAAMITTDRAPGLTREKWGFQSWEKYNKKIWNLVVYEAQQRFKKGIKKCINNFFIGYDYDPNVIQEAKKNASRANLSKIITFSTSNLENLQNPFSKKEIGTLISNPPYGERHNTENQLVAVYIQIGMVSKKHFKNWTLSILSSSDFLLKFLQMKSCQSIFLKNGSINCILKNYNIFKYDVLEHAQEYQNRLHKNIQKLYKWKDFKYIECFRVYDRDIPDYNVIVDVYEKWMIIYEYQTSIIINSIKSHKKLCHAIYYAKEILSIPINNIILKFRKKQIKNIQYQKLHNTNHFFVIREYHTKLLVNLIDYLDTGLFLETRVIRKLLGKISTGKDFLNLFSYTGTASVYAKLGGAKSTTNVDISKKYIEWSKRNMTINNLKVNENDFIQKNCLDWIKSTNKKFDLIFINPPTFSNSKKMKEFFDLKKHYLNLLQNLKNILRQNGNIIFSSSTNNFLINLNDINKIKLYAKNITYSTQSRDYLNKKYYSWLITHI